ncbi:Tetraspanin-11 [Acropora cervicornis]|uniref:Tetraspanin n=1 Tax=Acropora cervicornis TaxID=6130 RepID=A0AAD9QY48_ACRCE|nr:Tetraspanin-11 [Acropora cervicornis]
MCKITCIKRLLFASNFIFWLAGAAILGIGIWTEIDPGQFYAFIDNTGYSLPAKLLMAPGGFVMIVGFLGCCGTIKESRFLLRVYFACLLLTFAAEAVAGILGFLYREKIDEAITNRLRDEIQTKYGVTVDAAADQVVDNLQIELKCCGIVNFTDWAGSKWQEKNTLLEVPLSCCKEGESTSTCNSKAGFDASKINQEGCLEKLKEFVNNHLFILGAAGVPVAGIQV